MSQHEHRLALWDVKLVGEYDDVEEIRRLIEIGLRFIAAQNLAAHTHARSFKRERLEPEGGM